MAYADLLSDADNPHPSRYSGGEHEEMLQACGFSIPGLPSQQRACEDSGARKLTEVDFGDFGCFVCYK